MLLARPPTACFVAATAMSSLESLATESFNRPQRSLALGVLPMPSTSSACGGFFAGDARRAPLRLRSLAPLLLSDLADIKGVVSSTSSSAFPTAAMHTVFHFEAADGDFDATSFPSASPSRALAAPALCLLKMDAEGLSNSGLAARRSISNCLVASLSSSSIVPLAPSSPSSSITRCNVEGKLLFSEESHMLDISDAEESVSRGSPCPIEVLAYLSTFIVMRLSTTYFMSGESSSMMSSLCLSSREVMMNVLARIHAVRGLFPNTKQTSPK
mmetsp:Transcript_170580/g.547157  ORF Transcript_170580/g.547157 Transcript_170580/m.547157 type:complete len:271 (-) Transcript_170580:1681-2493(-)